VDLHLKLIECCIYDNGFAEDIWCSMKNL